MWETQVHSLGREDLLEKEMATHSGILAWKIPWMKEPGGLQFMRSQSQTRLNDFIFTYVLSILKHIWMTVYICIIPLVLEFKFYLLAECHILIVPFLLSPKIVQNHFIPSIYLPEMLYSLTLYSKEKELSFFHHNFFPFPFSSVQSLSRVWLFVTPWIAACQASLFITNSWSSLKLMPIKSVMPSSHLILCRPLLFLPQIPPSIRVNSFQWVNSLQYSIPPI